MLTRTNDSPYLWTHEPMILPACMGGVTIHWDRLPIPALAIVVECDDPDEIFVVLGCDALERAIDDGERWLEDITPANPNILWHKSRNTMTARAELEARAWVTWESPAPTRAQRAILAAWHWVEWQFNTTLPKDRKRSYWASVFCCDTQQNRSVRRIASGVGDVIVRAIEAALRAAVRGEFTARGMERVAEYLTTWEQSELLDLANENKDPSWEYLRDAAKDVEQSLDLQTKPGEDAVDALIRVIERHRSNGLAAVIRAVEVWIHRQRRQPGDKPP